MDILKFSNYEHLCSWHENSSSIVGKKMNCCDVLWFLMLIVLFSNSLAQSSSNSGNSQLFIGRYPIPSKTPAPLNIDTKKVKNTTLSPIIFTAIVGASTKIVNNGHAIDAILEETTPETTVTGGPLLEDVYNFYATRYFWSGNSSEPAGTLIDGADGVPIETVAVWYNKKYGSLANSLNYRDGIAEISFPVKTGPISSLTFVPFSEKLKKVRKPGSFVITNLAETFIWFNNYVLSPDTPYFSYPGSYKDPKTSKEYYCSTVIRFIPQINYISQEQYEDFFLTLENSKGEKLITAVPSHPQDDIPVIRAEGQKQVFIPLGKELLAP